MAKGLCHKCYYATLNGYKTYDEQLQERNFVENGIGILTDKKGNRWEVDIEDFELCSKHFWVDNGSGYAKSAKVGYLHRFLLPQFRVIDHIDRNTRNNHRENLRNGETVNGINLTKKGAGVSKFRGVAKMKNKWQARIQFNHERIYLGTFDTPQTAHDAIVEYARKNGLSEFYESAP